MLRVMLRDAAWCCVVLRGAAWCCVVLRDAAWSCVVLGWRCVILIICYDMCLMWRDICRRDGEDIKRGDLAWWLDFSTSLRRGSPCAQEGMKDTTCTHMTSHVPLRQTITYKHKQYITALIYDDTLHPVAKQYTYFGAPCSQHVWECTRIHNGFLMASPGYTQGGTLFWVINPPCRNYGHGNTSV